MDNVNLMAPQVMGLCHCYFFHDCTLCIRPNKKVKTYLKYFFRIKLKLDLWVFECLNFPVLLEIEN